MSEGSYVCPRCGNFGYLQGLRRGKRTYFYCYHCRIEDGKRRVWKCYLGPEKYVNVERFQELGLSGLTDKDRFRKYLQNLLDRLEPEDLKWLAEEIKSRLPQNCGESLCQET